MGEDVHVVVDHGEQQEWASWLADVRRVILAEFGEGHPFYEDWLAPSVTDPSSISRLVAAYVERMNAEVERLRDLCHRAAKSAAGYALIGGVYKELRDA